MQIIELDATDWKVWKDFYDDLLAALGAPEGHGCCTNALIDSMIWGGMNAIDPPYRIAVRNMHDVPSDVTDAIKEAKEALSEGGAYFRAQQGHDIIVDFEIFE